jgi:hypothetical protein
VQIDGGTEAQRALVDQAVKNVASVWRDKRFWALVAERRWLPGPNEGFIEGKGLRNVLEPHSPELQAYWIERLGWSNIGLPDATHGETKACHLITLNSHYVEDTSALINTVAHENTHIIGRGTLLDGCTGPDREKWLYTDTGEGKTAATIPWLVSYAFGDLAQCFVDKQRDAAATKKCMDGRIDMAPACRPKQECCGEPETPNLKAIRAKTDLCKAHPCDVEYDWCPAAP